MNEEPPPEEASPRSPKGAPLADEPRESKGSRLRFFGALVGVLLVSGMASAGVTAALSKGAGGAPPFHAVAMGVLTMQIGLIAGATLLSGRAGISRRRRLGLVPTDPGVMAWAALGVLGIGPTSEALVFLARQLIPEAELGALDVLESLVLGHSIWLLLPLMAILPGIGEELFFRGLLQRALGKGARPITVSAVAFSAFHLDPHHAIGVLPIGFYLAWLADHTGGTVAPIAAHATNNGAALVLAHSLGEERLSQMIAGEEQTPHLMPIVLGLCLTLLSATMVARFTRAAR